MIHGITSQPHTALPRFTQPGGYRAFQRTGLQSCATFGAAMQTTSAESEHSWLDPIREKINDVWRSIKDFFFTVAVKMIAVPFHHILLRPELMRKLVPHGNILLLHTDQKKLLDKRYKLHPDFALTHTNPFYTDSASGQSIQLQGHWLTSKTKVPDCLVVMNNGVAADWTYQLALAEKLVKEKNAAVFMFNNRGHGESTNELCTMGYHEATDSATAIVQAFDTIQDDLPEALKDKLKKIRKKTHWSKVNGDKLPTFLYGHSMGGAQAVFIPKSVDTDLLKRVNHIVDGVIVDSGYGQLDVFSQIPNRIKLGGHQWLDSSDFAKLFQKKYDVHIPLFDWDVTFGPWLTHEKVDKIAEGPLVNAITETLNDRMLAELDFKGKGYGRIRQLKDVIPGKLSAEWATRESKYHNNAPLEFLKKPILYLYAADDSDTTTPGHTMCQNIDPINKLRKKHGANPIQEVKLYGYHHNDSDIWHPFEDLDKETMTNIAGKKNANLWDGMSVTTSLRRGCLEERQYKAYLKAKEKDPNYTSDNYSEDVQVNAITRFIDSVLKNENAA